MTTDEILYIAETDELGRVVCVWCSEENSRPKPLRRPIKTKLKLQPSHCFGAPPSAVAAWIQGQEA